MSALSDHIEQFIKELLENNDEVSLQRNELAQYFACAPSQINYVLSTRFTLDRGYIIVSRRGSGGYIRVVRVDCGSGNLLHEMACNRVGSELTKSEALDIVKRLLNEKCITPREAGLMQAALAACTQPTARMEDVLRARAMREMLSSLMQCQNEEE